MLNGKLIIAHRGARAYEKENTIAAFKIAIKQKADMIEFDVRKTKDNKMIVFHDEKIASKETKDMSYQEIMNKLGSDVPTLEETLKFLSGKIKVVIHLKENGYTNEVIELILKYFRKSEIIIISEIEDQLKKIKENYPEIKTGLVMDAGIKNICLYAAGCFTKNDILNSRVDYLVIRWQLINRAFFKKAKKYSLLVFPWEIRDKELAERFLKEDVVKGIITNKPDLMKRY